MTEMTADVAVLGSGFGGSLTALLLTRLGLHTVLIDRGSHPRFAIGESSTPIANFLLRDLARKYNLPRLEPLARYGTWQTAYPDLVCGLKRGFSYFRQEASRSFAPRADHANELLVTASSDDAHSDMHWLRSDVDHFLVKEVQAAGIPFFDRTEVSLAPNTGGWVLAGMRLGKPVSIEVPFVIDATGEAGVVLRSLGIANDAEGLFTNSRAVYSHFKRVRSWHEYLADAGGKVEDHPFDCDDAALHHVLDEGWMWQLRFNNGVTSAGFVLDGGQHPLGAAQSPDHEWRALLKRYPSLAEQFEESQVVQPPGRLLQSGRLQRRAARMAGETWALLPNTAGFIDPLHSTGIAQTLCGIERLVQILGEHWHRSSLATELQRYEDTLRREIALVDKLVSGCYLARRNHRLFVSFSMLYFAAATTYERRRHLQQLLPGAAFLCSDDIAFCRLVDDFWEQLQRLVHADDESKSRLAQFEYELASAIGPYNHVGLCNPEARNMYRYTAAPIDW